MFNSKYKELSVSEKKVSDSVAIKTYVFTKETPVENFEYELTVNENGKIDRNTEQSPKLKTHKLKLYYYSYMHEKDLVSDLSDKNVLSYEDFKNSQFKSFVKVVNRASKIYIVDAERKNDYGYKVYEVRL